MSQKSSTLTPNPWPSSSPACVTSLMNVPLPLWPWWEPQRRKVERKVGGHPRGPTTSFSRLKFSWTQFQDMATPATETGQSRDQINGQKNWRRIKLGSISFLFLSQKNFYLVRSSSVFNWTALSLNQWTVALTYLEGNQITIKWQKSKFNHLNHCNLFESESL